MVWIISASDAGREKERTQQSGSDERTFLFLLTEFSFYVSVEFSHLSLIKRSYFTEAREPVGAGLETIQINN